MGTAPSVEASVLFLSNILFFSDLNLRSNTAKQPAAPVLSRDAAARHKGPNFHHPPAREKNLGTGNPDRPIFLPSPTLSLQETQTTATRYSLPRC